MALKEVSIALGIMAGSAGIANSGYGLYQNFIIRPAENVEYNRALLSETPLVVETVEIQPLTDIAMRIEVTVKIFKSGDILVESGSRRQYIPFRLSREQFTAGGLIATALANDTTLIDGVEYNVKVMRYIENMTSLADNKIQRERLYEDGSTETSIIDIRSNKVLETKSGSKDIGDAERRAIASSPYKKKIFIAK